MFCEIKTKKETTELRPKTLRYSLEDARTQLPKGEAGLILIKIPESWAMQPSSFEIINTSAIDFLGKSTRIAAVVVVWEVWLTVDAGLSRT